MQKTTSKVGNDAAGTHAGQVYRVMESSKKKSTNGMINGVRLINPSNLNTTEGENPTLLGEGSLVPCKKMLFCDQIEVAGKVLKRDATEKHLMPEAGAMYEIGKHPGTKALCLSWNVVHMMVE